jgi:hypothetical protein
MPRYISRCCQVYRIGITNFACNTTQIESVISQDVTAWRAAEDRDYCNRCQGKSDAYGRLFGIALIVGMLGKYANDRIT